MEKRGLGLLLMAMSLAFVFNVSTAEAQVRCDGGNFCDRDDDGWHKGHHRCEACPMFRIDCDDSDHDPNNMCEDVVEPATGFSVEVHMGDAEDRNWVEALMPICDGHTSPPSLGARFPPDCGPITVTPVGGGVDLELRLFAIAVRQANGFRLTAFFTSELNLPSTSAVPNDSVYVSDDLQAILSTEPPEWSNFELMVVNASREFLEKAHQPGKGDLFGTFAIGSLVFYISQP
jgi:hypothetical protein